MTNKRACRIAISVNLASRLLRQLREVQFSNNDPS